MSKKASQLLMWLRDTVTSVPRTPHVREEQMDSRQLKVRTALSTTGLSHTAAPVTPLRHSLLHSLGTPFLNLFF